MKKHNINILIVEDDEVDVMAIERAVSQLNISNLIFVAKDGIEALEKLRSGEIQFPFIVLMDLNLPRMNGIDCIKEIRKDEKLRRSIIFVLSTSMDEKDKAKAYDFNVAGYIIKSDTGDETDKVTQMLNYYLKIVELPNE